MSNDKLIELEHRLALAEREVEKTRAEVRALQEQERPRSRLRRDRILGLLGFVLVFAATRALDTQAAVTNAQVLTVKAPFRVLDSKGQGKVLMELTDGDGTADLRVGDVASAGATLGIGKSGNGFLTLRRASGKWGASMAADGPNGGVWVYDTLGIPAVQLRARKGIR